MKKPKLQRDFKRPHGEYLIVKESDRYTKQKIEKRDDRSLWVLIKEYINERKNGSIITRDGLIKYLYPSCGKNMRSFTNTIDSYKVLLIHENIGVLEKTSIRGQYKKVRDIPDILSLTLLKKIYSDKSWKSWFSLGLTLEQKIEAYK